MWTGLAKFAQTSFMDDPLHGLSPAILSEVFKVNETIPYDLRMRNKLYARNPKSVRYGTVLFSKNLVFDTTRYKKLWLLNIKKNIRKWTPD